jgi:hypothetical protein
LHHALIKLRESRSHPRNSQDHHVGKKLKGTSAVGSSVMIILCLIKFRILFEFINDLHDTASLSFAFKYGKWSEKNKAVASDVMTGKHK